MKLSKDTIVVARLEGEAPDSTRAALLSTFGFGLEADPDCRWFRPDLVSLKLKSATDESALERARSLPGVDRIRSFAGPLTLQNGVLGSLGEVRLADGVSIGGDELTVIAGPCSCESREQVLSAAELVAGAGAKILRGGTFKARTSPFSFGGLGEEGLQHMAEARERTGLPFVTEALESAQLDVVSRYADMIQIGSRNMQNFPLLFDAGNHPSGLPILLKRGLASTHQEFLKAAEYVLLGRIFAGHKEANLVLCERGIRTFDTSTRFTLDVGAIPVLQQRCDLPIIADPSHAAGTRSLVPPLARAAVAAGASGLLIEVHPEPDQAWCDGSQSLSPDEFRELMRDLARFSAPGLRSA
ncbi:MAG: 3-deoxy-7-phosphoheptulonate synthase [Planctomycetota bacterium]|jgi:3-deoxy-7-phosphoheptulonate synthase